MKSRKMLSADQYNMLFFYHDGELFWKTNTGKKNMAGRKAGSKSGNGYYQIGVNNINTPRSRIIYVMFEGNIPDGFIIDHRDRNKTNDKIENLRLATYCVNSLNAAKPKTNTSGFRGVYFRKQINKWAAKIIVNGKQIHLGSFKKPELAYEKYLAVQTSIIQ